MLLAVSSSSRLIRGARVSLRTLVLSSAVLAAGLQPVAAQSVGDDDGSVATQQLNLPEDVTVFGKSDPNVRKATAIVNGRIITGTDVDQRLALIITANGGKVSDEEKERLRVQVLRNLIDETLQIQEDRARGNRPELSAGCRQFPQVPVGIRRLSAHPGQFGRQHQAPDRGRAGVEPPAPPQHPALRQRVRGRSAIGHRPAERRQGQR